MKAKVQTVTHLARHGVLHQQIQLLQVYTTPHYDVGVEEGPNLWEEPSEGHRYTKHEAKINTIKVFLTVIERKGWTEDGWSHTCTCGQTDMSHTQGGSNVLTTVGGRMGGCGLWHCPCCESQDGGTCSDAHTANESTVPC